MSASAENTASRFRHLPTALFAVATPGCIGSWTLVQLRHLKWPPTTCQVFFRNSRFERRTKAAVAYSRETLSTRFVAPGPPASRRRRIGVRLGQAIRWTFRFGRLMTQPSAFSCTPTGTKPHRCSRIGRVKFWNFIWTVPRLPELNEGINKKRPTTRLIYPGVFHMLSQLSRQWDGIEILNVLPAPPPML
jgi:hypothetical protein